MSYCKESSSIIIYNVAEPTEDAGGNGGGNNGGGGGEDPNGGNEGWLTKCRKKVDYRPYSSVLYGFLYRVKC